MYAIESTSPRAANSRLARGSARKDGSLIYERAHLSARSARAKFWSRSARLVANPGLYSLRAAKGIFSTAGVACLSWAPFVTPYGLFSDFAKYKVEERPHLYINSVLRHFFSIDLRRHADLQYYSAVELLTRSSNMGSEFWCLYSQRRVYR